MHLNVNSMYTT